MTLRTQWMAALLIVGSTGAALGCGCSMERVRLTPVREQIVVEPSSPNWGTPFRAVGSVISAPFYALGSAFSPSERYVEPVGERLPHYAKVTYEPRLMPVGERFTTVKIYHRNLQPVGERFITVKRYHKTMLRPVGEKITTTKIITMRPVLEPVGEKTIIRTTRLYAQPRWSCD